ncbi:hypothetical protein E4U09_008216 [Claviceps aff. purpurea]|uniref:Uncharacterized protein n=1 Tax=Claviceps aff. purpurea TaxID=1967640 RepID=A0A9P7TXW8_9HYPO|nr:hypothetical protein E4U09_008216 [Claviceps aff. purpurea]
MPRRSIIELARPLHPLDGDKLTSDCIGVGAHSEERFSGAMRFSPTLPKYVRAMPVGTMNFVEQRRPSMLRCEATTWIRNGDDR